MSRWLRLSGMLGAALTGPILLEDLTVLAGWRAYGIPAPNKWIDKLIEKEAEDSINGML